MKKLIALLAVCSLLAGCGAPAASDLPAQNSAPQAQDGTTDPKADAYQLTFTAQTLDGETVDQSIFSNARVTMLNVWGTFCNPCISEMPDLGELAADGGADYQIIGLCADLDGTDELLTRARDIVSETGAAYLHLQPSESLGDILRAATAIPVTFFFDSEGYLMSQGVMGAKSKEDWSAILQEHLDALDALEAAAPPADTDAAGA